MNRPQQRAEQARRSSPVVSARRLSKAYHLWASPQARLTAPLLRRLARAPGVPTFLARRWERSAAAAAPPFFALRDVDLTVHHNETVGIVGRNGSGKSTLLQIVAGTVSPTSGTMEVDGRVAALLELGSGFNPEFTGRENVHLNAAILGLTPAETEARFDDIAAFADIGGFIDQPVKTYSSGMYVRLAFAVAANVDADVLILDEALSVGDEAFQRKCFSRLHSFKEQGGTILFVSHSAAAVVELCDRAVLLEGGELLMSGTPKSVVAAYHKLLFGIAPGGREARRDPAEPPGPDDPAPAAPAEVEQSGAYDPDLVPQSTVAYDRRGAEIRAARITTPDGRQVNVLDRRGEYDYRYDVHFLEDCFSVRFGMMAKSVSGLEIGGAVSSTPPQAIEFAPAGSVAHVRFRFRCDLTAGSYFLNAGVLGAIAGNETFLHRLIDAVMLRVTPDAGSLATGIVDFRVEPEVHLEAAGGRAPTHLP